jgi:hypothetical protein
MFFVLSKLLGFFAIPSNLIVLIGIVGLFYQAELFRDRFAAPACANRNAFGNRLLARRCAVAVSGRAYRSRGFEIDHVK